MKKKIILPILFIIALVGVLFFVFDKNPSESYPSEDLKNLNLRDVAYKDGSNVDNFTVYIKENDSYEPYLVIADDYSGNVLLLRKFLLDEPVCFSERKSHGERGGYYPNNYIDSYLNNNFISRFSEEMQENILSTPIDVATVKSVGGEGFVSEVETVLRKVFLLSAREMNIKNEIAGMEGTPLLFFKNKNNFIARTKDGTTRPYWLRSSYLEDDIQALVVKSNGSYTNDFVLRNYYIRPAFCLDGNVLAKASDSVVKNKTVYVIEG